MPTYFKTLRFCLLKRRDFDATLTSSCFESGNLPYMKTCTRKRCGSFDADVADNKTSYSCIPKILHLLKLVATALLQIFLPFYKRHHGSRNPSACDGGEVRTQGVRPRSEPPGAGRSPALAAAAGPHCYRTSLPPSLFPSGHQRQARGLSPTGHRRRWVPGDLKPRAGSVPNPPPRPVSGSHAAFNTRERLADTRPRYSAAAQGVGAGGVRAVRGRAVPQGRRGRTAQPCRAALRRPPTPAGSTCCRPSRGGRGPPGRPPTGSGPGSRPKRRGGSRAPRRGRPARPPLSPHRRPREGPVPGVRAAPRGGRAPREGRAPRPAAALAPPPHLAHQPLPVALAAVGAHGSGGPRRHAAAPAPVFRRGACGERRGLRPPLAGRPAGAAQRRPGHGPAGAGPAAAPHRPRPSAALPAERRRDPGPPADGEVPRQSRAGPRCPGRRARLLRRARVAPQTPAQGRAEASEARCPERGPRLLTSSS